MSHTVSSKQAQAYLIDPMNAPEPSQETGLGGQSTNAVAPRATPSSVKQRSKHTPTSSLNSNNPYRNDSAQSSPSTNGHTRSHSGHTSKGQESFPNYRAEAFGDFDTARPRSRSSHDNGRKSGRQDAAAGATRHRRTSSLQQRFPGDESNEPLKIIRRDSKRAYKSPHLRKHHIPGADTIDRLDPSLGGFAYHHEGPYDAALLARNSSFQSSPVAALQSSTEETIKATPEENIRDAIERHRPLEGTAQVPSGMPDRFGRVYTYEEGADLMREGVTDEGYKRWPGVVYHKDDLKGKGEPSFSLDRAMKAHKIDDNGIELEERQPLNQDDSRNTATTSSNDASAATASHVRRTSSLRAAGEGLKRRIGSLRHKKKNSQ